MLLPDGGAHADGEFVDLDAKELADGKMARFMDGDQDAEHEDADQDIEDRHAFSCLLAASSAATISSRLPPGRPESFSSAAATRS